jgi:hypothetical protein
MFGSLAQLALGVGGQLASSRANRSSRNNPTRAAEQHLATVPGAVRPFYDPFIQRGTEAYGRAQGLNQQYNNLFDSPGIDPNGLPNQYERMANNPTDFMNALMERYNPSEGYKFKQQQMLDAMRNSAASGGFAGTPFNQQQQAETVQGLLGSDMQQFLQNALGIMGAGISGKENRLLGRERALQSALGAEEGNMNRGYNASAELSNSLANLAGTRATNEYMGAQRRGQNAQNNILGWQGIGNNLQQSMNMFGPAMMGQGGGMGGQGGWGGASRGGFTPPTGGGYGSGNGSYF